jgi:pyruvate dehydrogenase E1 component alpha subunit
MKTNEIQEVMRRITFGMEKVNSLLTSGEIKVPVHLAFGHEVIASALICTMSEQDALFLPHRNIHYQFAAETNIDLVIDEILLKESGINGGNCGAMNMFNLDRQIVYSSSILGNNLAVAIGYSQGMRHSIESVTWVVTGDGAIEEGAWYEATLNATSLNLGCVFLVENNRWSLATSIEERRKDFDLSKFANFLGIQYVRLDSNNAEDYRLALANVRASAVNKQEPVIVEVFLETLGGYNVDEGGKSRYVNYHAGGIKNWVSKSGDV